MPDPWSLARDYINQQNNIANYGRQAQDNLLLNAIANQWRTQAAETGQGYAMQRLEKANEYNTATNERAYEHSDDVLER